MILDLINKYYGGYVLMLLLIGFCLIQQYLIYMAIDFLYDFIKNIDTNIDSKWHYLSVYALLYIGPQVISLIRFLILSFLQISAVRKIHHNMIIKAFHGGLLTFFDKIPIARVINKFSNDMSQIEDQFLYTISGIIIVSAMVFNTVIVSAINLSYYLILFFTFYVVIIVYIQGIYIVIKKDLFRCENITKTPIINQISEMITGRHIYKIFNKQEVAIRNLKQSINQNTQNVITKKALDYWFSSCMYAFNFFLPTLFAYGLAIYMLHTSKVQGKGTMISILYLLDVIEQIKWLVNSINNLETQVVSLERCDAFNKIPLEAGYLNMRKHEAYMKRCIHRKIDKFLPLKIREKNFRRLDYERINEFYFNKYFFDRGEITFKNVFAKYPISKDYVLKDISFTVKKGEKLGICGKTGSGKSTIIKLINHYLGLSKGEVLIDGYDISKIDSKKLRSEMLIISQEIALYEGTLRENFNPKFIKLRTAKNRKPKEKKKREVRDDESLLSGQSRLTEKLLMDFEE